MGSIHRSFQRRVCRAGFFCLSLLLVYVAVFAVIPYAAANGGSPVSHAAAGANLYIVQSRNDHDAHLCTQIYVGEELDWDTKYGSTYPDSGVTWTSSNHSVVTINNQGSMKTHGHTGTSTIKAEYRGKTASQVLTVVKAATGI
jgi:hypothetical protein